MKLLDLPLPIAALSAVLFSSVRAAEDVNILNTEIAREQNSSLLWGPYRPNVYFGVRPRIPKSFMGGLMWAKVDDFVNIQNNFRHTCEQGDGMRGYGWEEFDARSGGKQTMYDESNGLDVTTFFVKSPGGKHGGNWATRVRGKVRDGSPADLKTTMIFYASLEGLGELKVDNEPDDLGFDDEVVLSGDSDGLGKYKVTVTPGRGFHPTSPHPSYKDKPLDRTIVHSFGLQPEILWQSKPILFKALKDQIDEYLETYGEENAPPPWQIYTMPHKPAAGNLHMIQKVFEGDFEFDIIFNSASAEKELTSQEISALIAANHKSFFDRFISKFDLTPPFNIESLQRFSAHMFSNLIGGLGYFHGDSVVDRSYAPEYEEENEGFWEEAAEARGRKAEKLEGPSELFTTVPSRPFFPRGFLWDEGFHLLPIADWDIDLTLEVVKSWFNLMDEDGWIGREQILGAEARSKVPAEFQVQYPHYANPPTLFFIIDAFISKLGALNGTTSEGKESLLNEPSVYSSYLQSPEAGLQYLNDLYPKLKKHYYWFRKTQAGDLKSYDRDAYSTKEAYRWRGRTPMHILTSGLDDYPRPQPPHPGELHVDLISWMGMMTKSLKNIAGLLGMDEDVTELSTIETAIIRNIDDLHWSEKDKCYCDATIDDYEENQLVCHKGYISLFPFLTGLVDAQSDKLGHILNLLGDEEELWSEYGIRSLSKKDEFYGTNENYWRGPIWMNMNYLAVSQLLKYAQTTGPHQEKAKDLYTRLRINLVKTVYDSWQETGFAWEQYNPETGKGQRTQHFTGWTSLVVKIMGLPDLSEGEYEVEGLGKEGKEGKEEVEEGEKKEEEEEGRVRDEL
ncbi:mannosyl-oligosaccharide glucosidase protein [Rutstroemia sp. NJR-2017a WRK4]|nr:mannosyl-oligosaccharide glucosidase protein [Rutstroemia sp. NJR-2017a WRK4]